MKAGPADIVIPTTGRPTLGRLLQALARSRGPLPGKVLLVDDRRQPEHPLALPALPPEWERRIVILKGNSAGPAAARNTGWRASSAAWIAFLDDDVIPQADWLQTLDEDLADLPAKTAGSQGRIVVPLPPDGRPTDWERNVAGLETAVWITADMAYRRKSLKAAGGFDERFKRAYREDADLALRIEKAGFRIAYGSRQVLHPAGPSSFWTSVKLQAGNGDDALMRALHGRRWRILARAGPGRLPQHICTTLALLSVLFGSPRVKTAGLGVWAGLTGSLAWKRIAPGPRTAPELLKMVATSAVIPPAAVFHRLRGELRAKGHRSGGGRAFPGAAQIGLGDGEPPTGLGTAVLGQRPIRAVLFDRDGTLVEDVPYNGDPQKVRPKPGAAEALRRLREAGVATGVVSNQSGVARGLLTMSQVRSVNDRIEKILGPLAPWITCEHGPADGCNCRKPAPGMILEAARRLGVDPAECVVIGDIGADVDAARRAGAASILIPGPITLPQEIAAAPIVVRHLTQAVDLILPGPESNGARR